MKDKNGKELSVGDKVKIFTYYPAVVQRFEKNTNNEEMAHVHGFKNYKGRWMLNGRQWTVYSEEIRLFNWMKR